MVDADPLVSQNDTQPSVSEDWPARASATVVQYVGTVRDKTTGPALEASRNVVYAVAMGLIAFVVAILTLVLLFRMLVAATAYLPSVEEGESWLAFLIVGALFLIGGLVLWRKKEPR
ncbi:MAG: phage holin family protein [Acidimicrobiia bacterium]|nr:phage holin family protein [Acidimicrobiia bacterium]